MLPHPQYGQPIADTRTESDHNQEGGALCGYFQRHQGFRPPGKLLGFDIVT